MKRRAFALFLTVLLVVGVIGAVPAQAADTATFPQAVDAVFAADNAPASDGASVMDVNGFQYLVNFCKTEGELTNGTDYMVQYSFEGENGTVAILMDYNLSENAIAVALTSVGYNMDNYIAAIEINSKGEPPYAEYMFYGETPIGAAYLNADYQPGRSLSFYQYAGNGSNRSAIEEYNVDCIEVMMDFLHDVLGEGNLHLRDIGFVQADWQYDDGNKAPFYDVLTEDYFYQPVLWAVENNITNGTSTVTFSPNMTCTRAQVVTFLWRYAGMPEPSSSVNPFRDVDVNNWYGKAVLWAVENNITNGMSPTQFGPNEGCTRAQVVTFLARYMNGKPSGTKNPFTDVAKDAWYYDAVLWAVEKGITNGVSDTLFGPDQTCTRGQIVTFLWRAAGKPAV